MSGLSCVECRQEVGLVGAAGRCRLCAALFEKAARTDARPGFRHLSPVEPAGAIPSLNIALSLLGLVLAALIALVTSCGPLPTENGRAGAGATPVATEIARAPVVTRAPSPRPTHAVVGPR